MLKVEELTKEQLIAEYNLLRTESEAEVTNLRGKVDSLRGKNDSLCGEIDSLRGKMTYEFRCLSYDNIETAFWLGRRYPSFFS